LRADEQLIYDVVTELNTRKISRPGDL